MEKNGKKHGKKMSSESGAGVTLFDVIRDVTVIRDQSKQLHWIDLHPGEIYILFKAFNALRNCSCFMESGT